MLFILMVCLSNFIGILFMHDRAKQKEMKTSKREFRHARFSFTWVRTWRFPDFRVQCTSGPPRLDSYLQQWNSVISDCAVLKHLREIRLDNFVSHRRHPDLWRAVGRSLCSIFDRQIHQSLIRSSIIWQMRCADFAYSHHPYLSLCW